MVKKDNHFESTFDLLSIWMNENRKPCERIWNKKCKTTFDKLPESRQSHLLVCAQCRKRYYQHVLMSHNEKPAKHAEALLSPDKLADIPFKEEIREQEIKHAVFEIQALIRGFMYNLADRTSLIFHAAGFPEEALPYEASLLKGFYEKQNYMGAYHLSKKLLERIRNKSWPVLIHVFHALEAAMHEAAAALLKKYEKKIKANRSDFAFFQFLKALNELMLGNFLAGLNHLADNAEKANDGEKSDIYWIAAELLQEIELIRFSTPGFTLDPTEKPSLFAEYMKKQRQSLTLFRRRLEKYFRSYLLLPEPLRCGSLLRSLTSETLKDYIEFLVVDLTPFDQMSDNPPVAPAEEENEFVFYDLPHEYDGRIVFFIIVSGRSIRKIHPSFDSEKKEKIIKQIFLSRKFLDIDAELLHVEGTKVVSSTDGCRFSIKIRRDIQKPARVSQNLCILAVL